MLLPGEKLLRSRNHGFCRAVVGGQITQEETVAAELKAAGASLVLAMAAAENGDWAAAEQGLIDAQERSALAMKEIQAKLAEPVPAGTSSAMQT